MKAYLSIKYHEDGRNQQLINELCAGLRRINIEPTIMVGDYDPDVLMAHTFRLIDDADIFIAECSEKGVGIGIEAGYATAKHKPVILVAQKGTEISKTLEGLAMRIIYYSTIADMEAQLAAIFSKLRSSLFVLMRPDNRILMQLRDDSSRRFKHMWCFPGGSAEGNEEHIDTLIREVKEEYEIDLSKEACVPLMKRLAGRSQVYVCKIDATQQPVMHEGADMKWMTIDEIKQMTIGYNQGDIVKKVEEYLRAQQ
jgi:2'-deoxynucleoside 5'-phosphate N-hydrolase